MTKFPCSGCGREVVALALDIPRANAAASVSSPGRNPNRLKVEACKSSSLIHVEVATEA